MELIIRYISICYRPQRSWGKVMFSQACVILFTGGCLPQCMLVCHTPLETDTPREQTPLPREAKTPPEANTPRKQTPPRGTHSPRSRHPPGADTPLLGGRHPPSRSRHPYQKHTPPSRHPPEADTHPPGSRHPPPQSMLWDMVNARAVSILLECNLVYLCVQNWA